MIIEIIGGAIAAIWGGWRVQHMYYQNQYPKFRYVKTETGHLCSINREDPESEDVQIISAYYGRANVTELLKQYCDGNITFIVSNQLFELVQSNFQFNPQPPDSMLTVTYLLILRPD